MSSFFALVTPLSVFDGSPAVPGQLPVFPSLPGLPSNGLPPFAGQLPSGPGRPPVTVPPTLPGTLPVFPSIDNSLPFPGFPGYPSQGLPGFPGYPSQGLPGGPLHPWLPGHIPGEIGGTLPTIPTIPAPVGSFWAYSPQYGEWVKVPDAYKPPPDTHPPPTPTPTT